MPFVPLVCDWQLVGSAEGQGCGLELVCDNFFTSGGLQGYGKMRVYGRLGYLWVRLVYQTGISYKYQQMKTWTPSLLTWVADSRLPHGGLSNLE